MPRILYKNISTKLKKDICKSYIEGSPSTSLYKKYGFSPTTILKIVKEMGGEIRQMKEIKTKYCFDHLFFNKIDTEDKAYFLGFLLADGHISNKEVMLYLNAKDQDIIKKFVKSIKGNNKIRTRFSIGKFNDKVYVSKMIGISLRSDQMLKDLKRHGFNSNKSSSLKVPKIRKNLQRHFWRGVWDGDGYVSTFYNIRKHQLINGEIKKYKHFTIEIGLCGLKNLLENFCKFLKENNINTGKIRKDGSIYTVKCNGNESCKILNLFYKKSFNKLYLERKYKKYLEYTRIKK